MLFISSCTEDKDITMEVPDHELNPIDRVEVEYFFDNVDYRLVNKNPPSTEVIVGVEHNAEFSSIAGSTEQVGKLYLVNYENNEVLGKKMSGSIDFVFDRTYGKRNVDIDLLVGLRFSSFIYGDVYQDFELNANNIPYNRSYVDDFTGLNVEEYLLTGENACNSILTLVFEENNDQYKSTLITKGCKDRAFIKIKVHFK
jgi:hypothetical protein